jgi:hypothetical protein
MNVVLVIDKQQMIGTLRAAGTKDRDVLYARKQEMLTMSKGMRIMGFIWMACGLLVSLTIILAIMGLPMAGLGFLMWWRGSKNIKIAEATFKEYLGDSPVGATAHA